MTTGGELELFWVSGSPFSWRVMLALEIKRLPYRSSRLDRSKEEQRSPAYLAINPRGRVPALRHGDVVVWESVACLAYLDRVAPDPPLFGATPAEAARIWRTVMECVAYLDDRTDAVILPFYFGGAEQQRAEVTAALATVAAEITRLEAELAREGDSGDSDGGDGDGGGWLAGSPRPSAADCTVYPMLRSLLRAAGKPAAEAFAESFGAFLPLESRCPRLDAWMKRVEALPGYDRTFPPHWR